MSTFFGFLALLVLLWILKVMFRGPRTTIKNVEVSTVSRAPTMGDAYAAKRAAEARVANDPELLRRYEDLRRAEAESDLRRKEDNVRWLNRFKDRCEEILEEHRREHMANDDTSDRVHPVMRDVTSTGRHRIHRN